MKGKFMPKIDTTAVTLERQAATDSELEQLPEFDTNLAAMSTNGTAPTPALIADDWQEDHAGWFELSADVKAVRGKNTSDGLALEIVLDASIDSHTAEVMALIGKSFTRVLFKPYVYQQPLPTPAPEQASDQGEADGDQADA